MLDISVHLWISLNTISYDDNITVICYFSIKMATMPDLNVMK